MTAGPNLYTSSSESALDNKQTIIKFATLADLNTAISRGQAADWESGQEIVVSAEPYGFSRIWNGSDALTVVLPNSNIITLASSSNTILATSGTPSGGNNGDYAWDKSTQLLYGPKKYNIWGNGNDITDLHVHQPARLPDTSPTILTRFISGDTLLPAPGAAVLAGSAAAYTAETNSTASNMGGNIFGGINFKLTASNSDNAYSNTTFSSLMDWSASEPIIQLIVYNPYSPKDNNSTNTVQLYFFDNIGKFTYINLSTLPGTNVITLTKDQFNAWSVVDSNNNWKTVKSCRIYASGVNSGLTEYTFCRLTIGGRSRKSVHIIQDSNYGGIYTYLKDTLVANKQKITINLHPRDVGLGTYLTKAQLLEMYNLGIADYGVRLDNYLGFKRSYSEIVNLVKANFALLAKIGIPTIPVVSYANGNCGIANGDSLDWTTIHHALQDSGICLARLAQTSASKLGIINTSNGFYQKYLIPYWKGLGGTSNTSNCDSTAVSDLITNINNLSGSSFILLHDLTTNAANIGSTTALVSDVVAMLNAFDVASIPVESAWAFVQDNNLYI